MNKCLHEVQLRHLHLAFLSTITEHAKIVILLTMPKETFHFSHEGFNIVDNIQETLLA